MKPAGLPMVDPHELLIWIDESLLVINMPAGLPTLPDGYDPRASHVRGLLEERYGPLWIVHRLGLYARSLQIQHPESGESLSLQAPYPKDFDTALRYLRKFRS
jgi:23S rRNA-/tRNA-specific pseudouridylate synthase